MAALAVALADQIIAGRYVQTAGSGAIRDARGVRFAESSWYPVIGLRKVAL